MNQLICLILLFAGISCQQPQSAPIPQPDKNETSKIMTPTLIHTVYFWTKDGTSPDQLKSFEQGLIKLGTCPQIQNYYWGPPAPTEARGVVDNSYDYAINVHFGSVEKQNEYQEEPVHLEFIETYQDLWEKVIVYDNMVE